MSGLDGHPARGEKMSAEERVARGVERLRSLGVRRVHVLAWRDLDDDDAGGSEVHADEFMRRWAAHGLDVVHRSSAAAGLPATARRNGYDIVRRGSRYSVFPRAIASELAKRMGRSDALVEIWNGVPWFSPVWCRGPNITILHHIHGPMWDQIMPRPFAAAGRLLEARLAPPFYRRTAMVTPSSATRDELIELGFPADRVRAFPNGIDARFRPGSARAPHPHVVAVGRLAPVKRFDRVIDAAVVARRDHPTLTLEIIGSGPLERELRNRIEAVQGGEWITLAGKLTHEQLVERYQRAWLVMSGSIAEGWGLSLTEGAACGTPCIATDIRGHRSSVRDGESGLLVAPGDLGATLGDLLHDANQRARLSAGALAWAGTLTWESSAAGVTETLVDSVVAHRARQR